MYVRLAFSVAAHLEPEILIVDEVLAVGDAEFQKKCLNKMKDISETSRTVIFVSHNQAAIESLCDTCALLQHGELKYFGSTAKALNLYRKMRSSDAQDMQNSKRLVTSGLVLTRATVRSPQTQALNLVRVGDTLELCLEYECDAAYSNVEINIGITTLFQEERAALMNRLTNKQIDFKVGVNTVNVSVPKFLLGPGEYGMNVMTTSKGITKDWVTSATHFEVDNNDYYGTGNMPPEAYSKYILDQSWEIL